MSSSNATNRFFCVLLFLVKICFGSESIRRNKERWSIEKIASCKISNSMMKNH